MPSGQGPGSRTDPDVFEYAQELFFLRGLNASQIAELVNRKFGRPTITARGVRKWLLAWERDASGLWDIRAADPETSKVVLSVMAELIELDIWTAQSLTAAEADLLARLAAIAPDMPKDAMYLWTRRFLAAETSAAPVGDLLTYLAFRPWADGGARYRAAGDAGYLSDLIGFGHGDLNWMLGPDAHDDAQERE